MTLRIPTTAASPAEWVRRAAGAVNSNITALAALAKRVVTLEAFQTSATASLTSLGTRTTALETYTHTSFTLTPATLPGAPVHGMVVTDIADGKLKFYDGTVWQSLY